METCNPLLVQTEEGDGEEEAVVEEEWTGGVEMAGDMWDGGREESEFTGLQQFVL